MRDARHVHAEKAGSGNERPELTNSDSATGVSPQSSSASHSVGAYHPGYATSATKLQLSCDVPATTKAKMCFFNSLSQPAAAGEKWQPATGRPLRVGHCYFLATFVTRSRDLAVTSAASPARRPPT